MLMEFAHAKIMLKVTNVRLANQDTTNILTVLVNLRQFLCKYLNNQRIITECKCSENGAVDNTCDDDGKCTCKEQVDGDKCDKCLQGHYNFPMCKSTYFINQTFFGSLYNQPYLLMNRL